MNGVNSIFVETCMLLMSLFIFLFQVVFHIISFFYEVIVPPKEKSVVGEIVLITGAGHGIGKEVAKQYGELGAKVVCVDINTENNQATVNELKKLGVKAYAYTCDVCSREKVLELGQKVQSEVGDVSILVNNAGIMPSKRFLAHTSQDIKKMFDVNVFAHFWMLEAFLPTMIKHDKGHIVCISSVAGLIGGANIVPYCASKFAVRGLMYALSEEFRKNMKCNVQITTIYPYITDTGLCKKPIIRFKNFMKPLSPAETAKTIVQSQRRGYHEASAPSYLFYANNFTRILPRKCIHLFYDMLGVELGEHD